MAKVFGVHEIALHPGVQVDDFARFITQEYIPSALLPGMKMYLLRGDRGERDGQCVVVDECESVARRDSLLLSPDNVSVETEQWTGAIAPLIDKWRRWRRGHQHGTPTT